MPQMLYKYEKQFLALHLNLVALYGPMYRALTAFELYFQTTACFTFVLFSILSFIPYQYINIGMLSVHPFHAIYEQIRGVIEAVKKIKYCNLK
jgi:hypothetical protein